MARGQRDRVKEQYWRRQVAAWRRSGTGVRAYCRAQGLSEPSFYAWRRVLAQRAAQARTAPAATARGRGTATASTTPAAAQSPFVPLRVVPDAAARPAAVVEVVLRGGRVLRLAENFSAQALRQLLAALEELPC